MFIYLVQVILIPIYRSILLKFGIEFIVHILDTSGLLSEMSEKKKKSWHEVTQVSSSDSGPRLTPQLLLKYAQQSKKKDSWCYSRYADSSAASSVVT